MRFAFHKEKLLLPIAAIAVYIIIYFYFQPWQTHTFYGDDLYLYKAYFQQDSFAEKIDMPSDFGKFRPVHGVILHLLLESFRDNAPAYYFFNVGIQALNTLIFGLLIRQFLGSAILSIFISLLFGLSRFSLFNMTQLLNGGALEGLAMTFFLGALYFIIKALRPGKKEGTASKRYMLWAILLSNLSMYTHERYIVLFPFILLVIFSGGGLSRKQKTGLCFLTIGSVLVNVLIKKYVYSTPFFLGTANASMDFSLSSAFAFFIDALLSIFQVNSGPVFLIGVSFRGLPVISQILIILMMAGLLMVLVLYLVRLLKGQRKKDRSPQQNFRVFLLLLILFGLLLAPAISTIRLEQRWLQASLSVFLLLFVFAFHNLDIKRGHVKVAFLVAIGSLFIWADYTYLRRGADNIYMVYSEKAAAVFREAIATGVIRPESERLFIWEKQNDVNNDRAMNWNLGSGYIFEFYQSKEKEIHFVDPVPGQLSFSDSALRKFNEKQDQVIYIDPRQNNTIVDISWLYLKDSLKNFKGYAGKRVQYNQEELLITNKDADKFLFDGLYGDENGASWTNGNVSIGFLGDFDVKDTLTIELNSYMPPVCKDVIPQLIIETFGGKECLPVLNQRAGNKFLYSFYFRESDKIEVIRIQSKTIKATPPDERTLSFPFISLKITKRKQEMRDVLANTENKNKP